MTRTTQALVLSALLLIILAVGLGSSQGQPGEGHPVIAKGLVGVKLHERGAHLAEGFDADEIDTEQWRIWISDEGKVKLHVRDGRFYVEGRGSLGHNGLWQLGGAKYKDVALIGRMDIRGTGARPHQAIVHLCGGEMPRSPDHWIEVTMQDRGEEAQFSVGLALPDPTPRRGPPVVLPRRGEEGFLAKLELDAGTNLCSMAVHDGETWWELMEPVELLLRTTRCEVKIRGGGGARAGEEEAQSTAWFDDVRIYPRPATHPVLLRIVNKDGSRPWARPGGRWPPTIQVAGQAERSVGDLVVELWTADGETLVSRVQSKHMGHYMLPLKDAPWDVYPVAAKVRLLLDGEVLGEEVEIPLEGLEGLYPDDVWNLILE
ncbi:MAG: hypothetical protein PVH68_06385 [Armatimonadota bacterium]